jgi:hypothetical protein
VIKSVRVATLLKHVLDRVSEVENYVVDLVSGEGRADEGVESEVGVG